MITYLSSLYDVFPEPPQMHPLFDMDSQRRVKEYRESAQILLYWCREKTALYQERTFPSTLIELKRTLNELNRFRTEEVPLKQRDKQHLFSVYRELEVIFHVFLSVFEFSFQFYFLRNSSSQLAKLK